MDALLTILILAFYVAIIVGFYKWGAYINETNGRDRTTGGIVGVFGGFIGIIILYIIGKKE